MPTLWLDPIPAQLRAEAVTRWKAGDAVGFLILAGNTYALDLVVYNMQALKASGLYEEALLPAFIATSTNNAHWPLTDLRKLFQEADRERLRAVGSPLPGPGPFTIYRGVAGKGRARRVRGLSWTASMHQAWWFASGRAWHGRLADPAVFRVTVPEKDVWTYCNDRQEEEFIIRLSTRTRPTRAAVDQEAYGRWLRERRTGRN